MGLTFDTGLASSQRKAIRDAIVARLAPMLKTAGGYLQRVTTVPRPIRGEHDAEGRQLLVNALLGGTPGVAVALGRLKFEPGGGDATESDGELELAFYVASEQMRDVVEGRLYADVISAADATADPGIFVILEHLRQRLLGQELGVATVNELRPEEEDEILTADNVTIWELRFRALVNASVDVARDTVQRLTSIEDDLSPDTVPSPPPFITTVDNVEA